MTLHSKIALSDSEETRLTPVGTHSGMDITIQSVNDSGYVYIGGVGVSAQNYGYRLSAGHAISFELPSRDSIYAIASNPGMYVVTLRTGLEAQD